MTSETVTPDFFEEYAETREIHEFDSQVLEMKSRLFAKKFGLSNSTEVKRAALALFESELITTDIESFDDLRFIFAEYLWVRDVPSEQIARPFDTNASVVDKEIIPHVVSNLSSADGAFFRLVNDPIPSIDPQLYAELTGTENIDVDTDLNGGLQDDEDEWYITSEFIRSIKTVQILTNMTTFNDAYIQLCELGLTKEETMVRLQFFRKANELLNSFLTSHTKLTDEQLSFLNERFYHRAHQDTIAQQMKLLPEQVAELRVWAIARALQSNSIEQTLINLRELGCTKDEIAEYTGLSTWAIARKVSMLTAAGLSTRRAHNPHMIPGHHMGKNIERYAAIEYLLNEGVSRMQIAQDLNLKIEQVYTIARKLRDEGRVVLPEPQLNRVRPPNPLELTQAELDSVLTARLEYPDMTYKQLAAELGVNKQRIVSAINRLREQGRLPAARTQIHLVEPEKNEVINNEIRKLLLQGHSREYIAQATGVTTIAVKSRILRMRKNGSLPNTKSPKRKSNKAEMYAVLRQITAYSSHEEKAQAITQALTARIGVNFVNNNPDVVRNLTKTVEEVLRYKEVGYEQIKKILESGDDPIITERAIDNDKRSIPFHLAVDTEAIQDRLRKAPELARYRKDLENRSY